MKKLIPIINLRIRKNKMKKNRKIFIIIVIFLALLLVFGNKSYKSTVKQYVTATMQGDGRKVVNLMPKQYVRLAISQGSYKNKSEMVADYNDVLNKNMESFENTFGEDWKYKYKIKDVYKYQKSEIEGFITISNYGYLLPKVRAIKEVTYELTVYSNEYESSTNETILLVKLGRKWYVADAYS